MRATCCSFPIPTTAFMDPFAETPTLVMIGDVVDPITRQHYDRDPRWIAKKAELYLKNSGLADTAYFGAEAEFFIFDNIRFDQNAALRFLLHRCRRRPLEFRPRKKTISVIVRVTRKAISRFRPPITIRICAAKWWRP